MRGGYPPPHSFEHSLRYTDNKNNLDHNSPTSISKYPKQ